MLIVKQQRAWRTGSGRDVKVEVGKGPWPGVRHGEGGGTWACPRYCSPKPGASSRPGSRMPGRRPRGSPVGPLDIRAGERRAINGACREFQREKGR